MNSALMTSTSSASISGPRDAERRPGGGGAIRGSLVAMPQRKQIRAFSAISVPQCRHTIQLDYVLGLQPSDLNPQSVIANRRSAMAIGSRQSAIYNVPLMIPVRDVIPSRTTPVVTVVLVAVNLLAFLYQSILPLPEMEWFVRRYGMVPAAFSWADVVTSMFLHGSLAHLLGNMLSLWIFGDNIEDRLGHGRYLAFYLITGAAAALAHLYADPGSAVPTIGASGAIAGVMGGYFVLYPHSRVITWLPPLFLVEVPAVLFLGLWFFLQLVSGVGNQLAAAPGDVVGGIAFWAHVGGFVVGAVLVKLMARPERANIDWYDAYQQ
jgi:membrane associated rhomboid family serine protease